MLEIEKERKEKNVTSLRSVDSLLPIYKDGGCQTVQSNTITFQIQQLWKVKLQFTKK